MSGDSRPPRPPETSLATEILFESIDCNNMKVIKDLVTIDHADLGGHDWLHHGGRTPMHRAVEVGSLLIMQLLVDLGGDVNVPDGIGRTPVHLAARLGSVDILRVLLQSGRADLYAGSHGKEHTPLHIAALHGFDAAAATLIEFGADVNAINTAGQTALHLAADQNKLAVAKVLVQAGVDLTIKTFEFKHTALHAAASVGSKEVGLYLQACGGRVHEGEREGTRTALDLACAFGHHQLGGLLFRHERSVRESAESHRVATEEAAAAAQAHRAKEEQKQRLDRIRAHIQARRESERAERAAAEAERQAEDAAKGAKARVDAMARIKRLAKERKERETM